jgi:HPt (histidine-containing phosphotransfer) domain-containing protein
MDKNFVPKLLKEFLISTPLMISELHELFELKNWKKMTKLAHKLKSNTANIAAKKLTQTLSLIEIEATNKNKNGQIIQLINELTTSSTKLCLAIEMDIKNLEK